MDSIVSVSSGALRGAANDGVHSFRGIPYAAPVGGANRFLRPQPVQPWAGERDATADGLIQPQVPMPPPFGAELPPAGDDSLNLNVWTPNPSATGLPVLVWIHGGAFNAGSGVEPTYEGASFARNGLVCGSGRDFFMRGPGSQPLEPATTRGELLFRVAYIPAASNHSSFPSNHFIRRRPGPRHRRTSEFSTGLVRAPGGVVAEEVAAAVAT